MPGGVDFCCFSSCNSAAEAEKRDQAMIMPATRKHTADNAAASRP